MRADNRTWKKDCRKLDVSKAIIYNELYSLYERQVFLYFEGIDDGMTDIVKEITDLRYLNWSGTRHSSGTAGSFLKAYSDTDHIKKYYKLSDYDPVRGIVGHECVNEIIVQRLLEILGYEHLSYRLLYALITVDGKEQKTWLCESADYKYSDESKLALEDFYIAEKEESEAPIDFLKRMGWEANAFKMIITDFLIINRDRHGANIEVLRSGKNRSLRLAPMFDHGLSFVCRTRTEKELDAFDPMADKRVQSFLGSNSLFENLKLVPAEYIKSTPALKPSDREYILNGMEEILKKPFLDKIWEILWRRFEYLGKL